MAMAAAPRPSPSLPLMAIVLVALLLLASFFPSSSLAAAYNDVPQEEGAAGYARFCQKQHCGGRKKLQEVVDPLRSTPPPPAPGSAPPVGPAPTVPLPQPPPPPGV